ncbi:MAG TPA: hypothetical protein VK929_17105 [Longimicrobiales bacterium]|nr:hypothetical protein [Longimicrobiales bacterium]
MRIPRRPGTRGRSGAAALAVAATAVLAVALPAAGQVASPSTAALGMADNFTATARGYSALAWNPAGLALSGGPSTSALIGTVRALTGLGPVTLADLASVQGEVVSDAVRRQWLAEITAEGGQAGAAGFDMTWAAIQFGNVGLQFSTTARALNNVSPGLAELLLVGNVDEGTARAIDAGGSSVDMSLYSTAAAGYAVPFQVGPDMLLSIGLSAKYTFGHSMALSGQSTGGTTTDPITVDLTFPVAYSPLVGDDGANQYQTGGGFSFDIGAGLEMGAWTLAATAVNLVSTFEWDPDQMHYREMRLSASDGEVESSFEQQAFSAAPASVRQALDDYTFQRNLALGVLYRHNPRLMISADARHGSTDGLATRPPMHVGAGLEYRLLPWLPVQAGAAMVRLRDAREGAQFAGGMRIEVGSFELSASAGRREVGGGGETMFMVSLLSHVF